MPHTSHKLNLKLIAATAGVTVLLVVPIWVLQLKLNMQDITERRVPSAGIREEVQDAKDELKKIFIPLPNPPTDALEAVQTEAVKDMAEKLKEGN